MENEKKSGKAGKALLIGAAIGGALGILLAPDKGKNTRKKIAAKPGEIKEAVKDKINDALDGLEKELKTAKVKVKKL
jgi:gas vesicle protein